MLHHHKDSISYMNESMSNGRRGRGCAMFSYLLLNGFLLHIDIDQGPWIMLTSS